MTQPRRPGTFPVLVLALTGTLVACTAESRETEAGPLPSSSVTATDGGSAAPSPEPTDDREIPGGHVVGELAEGPLIELLGAAPRTVQEYAAEHRHMEDLIAGCMHEQGFTYRVTAPTAGEIEVIDGPVLGTVEFAQAHGYGAVSMPPSGLSWSISQRVWQEDRAEMSEAEGEAFDDALYGPVTGTGEDGYPTRSGGCHEWAAGRNPDDPYLEGVLAELDRFGASLRNSPEFVDLDREWATCMREEGYAATAPWLTREEFQERAAALSAESDLDPASTPAGQELRAEEIATALADLACQEQVDYLARWDEISIALQEDYIETHRADLDALVEGSSR